MQPFIYVPWSVIKVEPIGHISYTLSFFLFVHGIINVSLSPLEIVLIVIGSELPDLIDAIIFRGADFSRGHRSLTHTIFFLAFLFVLANFIPLIIYLAIASTLHVLEDIISGGTPVWPFSPLSKRYQIMLFTKEQTSRVGAWIKSILDDAFVYSDRINAELAWCWGQTILGSYLLSISLIVYLFL